MIKLLLLLILVTTPLLAKKKFKSEDRVPLNPSQSSQLSLKSLYNTLDPLSISQHLTFYELYPDSTEGRTALSCALKLLNSTNLSLDSQEIHLPKLDIQAIISLVTRQAFDPPVQLSEEQFCFIDKISAHLYNRKLKGSTVWSKEEVLKLPSEEIDLSRGLLIDQFAASPNAKDQIRQYEASLDLMALQIQARLSPNATHHDKLKEINQFVFHEMQFRFPPHSIYAKDIDLYTFLPSVIDSRQGVCLGVSILYLCLGQRLDLPLEVITPPGHIFLRYRDLDTIVNIETTARGINLASESYLGINTRKLQMRTIKEVIGMAFQNQAAVFWGKGDYKTTVDLYEKALPYLEDDPLLKMFLGLNYLFVGKHAQGTKLLKEIQGMTFEEAISQETLPDDYLNKKVDIDGIKAVFLPVDETRESILKKQKELQAILFRYPSYRAGLLMLATTWMQLGRGSEALEVLQKYHKIDPNNSIVEYYLAISCSQRLDYNQAWAFLKNAEKITLAREHYPKALLAIRQQLRHSCPEP